MIKGNTNQDEMDVIFVNDARFGDGDRLVQVPPHVLTYFRAKEDFGSFHREAFRHDGRVAADRPPVALRLDGPRYEIVEELVIGNETPGTVIKEVITRTLVLYIP